MTLSASQKNALFLLSKPREYVKAHPRDAFNSRTLDALKKKGLVEFYHHMNFLHGAVRLTKEGKKVVNSL